MRKRRFEDRPEVVVMESGAKECINSWPLGAEKGKEMDFSPEAFRRNTLILEF